MKKNMIVIIVISLLVGLLFSYFIVDRLQQDNTLSINSKNNTSAIKNFNNDKTDIGTGSESDLIDIRFTKENILKEKYGKILSSIEDEVIKSKLSEAFLNSQVSEDFLSQSLSYINGDIKYLPETKQLFKNISFYEKKIKSIKSNSLNIPFFDEYDSIRYLIPLINLRNLDNFGISESEMVSYEKIQNSFLFLKNPLQYKNFASLRNEDKIILDWKNGISIPDSILNNDPYLFFLLKNTTRSVFKNQFLQKIPKTKNDVYLMNAFLARFGVDLQYLNLETLESKDLFIEYFIDNVIDYSIIDKTLLSHKNYCSDIVNPRISKLCTLYTENEIGNEKDLRIFKEYLIYRFLYQK